MAELARDGKVTVRYFAGARAAAGTESEQVPAAALTDLLAALGERHGEPLRRVLSASSFLVDGAACRDRAAVLPDGCTLDVLPPFAGG
jgi:sulfur-carrier protein